jgi:alkanesulfonate monooxygenase SsuD/methylene tetrahydromethanopterin reductase-like flavin-dependent oxidoreductase (luciferase family)
VLSEIADEVASELGDIGIGRVQGDAEDVHDPRLELDDEKNIELGEVDGVHGEVASGGSDVKIGVLLNTQTSRATPELSDVYDQVCAEAVAAEDAGFDGCFLPEHHFQDDQYLPAPLVLLGALAAVTSRIELGTCVTPLPLHNAIELAESIGVLDQLSRGRAVLGVGLGWSPVEFAAFGTSQDRAVGQLEDGLRLLDETFGGAGSKIPGAAIRPVPYGRRRIPVLVGGGAAGAIDRAAFLSDGWIADNLWRFEDLQAAAQRMRGVAQTAGRPGVLAVLRECHITKSGGALEDWWAPARQDLFTYFQAGYFNSPRFSNDPIGTSLSWPPALSSLAADRFVVGTANEVRAELGRYEDDLGCDYLICILRHPAGPGHREVVDQLRAIGEVRR